MTVRGLIYRIGIILVLLEIGGELGLGDNTAFTVGILLMILAATYPVLRAYAEGATTVFWRPLWRVVTRIRRWGDA